MPRAAVRVGRAPQASLSSISSYSSVTRPLPLQHLPVRALPASAPLDRVRNSVRWETESEASGDTNPTRTVYATTILGDHKKPALLQKFLGSDAPTNAPAEVESPTTHGLFSPEEGLRNIVRIAAVPTKYVS